MPVNAQFVGLKYDGNVYIGLAEEVAASSAAAEDTVFVVPVSCLDADWPRGDELASSLH
jgi:hypothetical protein